ncbi:hypothetical protein LEN26_011782 [Aphanomyces euteiches]|nr:hypothetical protein AeMF1_019751 [Aphanomyces euteiches]KAH9119134.1 hypothetical protein LEN26_011782 [Aphanomyces euteiches]KAH9182435.1 hypothetical protein AeNC1_015589 [Aphanomyces euteiches]
MRVGVWLSCLFGVATARVFVALTPKSNEYTDITPENLPTCPQSKWALKGQTYDSFTACSASPTTVLAVNPFRCASYSVNPSQGLYACDKCYFAWSYAKNSQTQIVPWSTPAQAQSFRAPISAFFVPQRLSHRNDLKSCLMVMDSNLRQLCDYIVREDANLPRGSKATCVKGSVFTPFANLLGDADQCRQYEIYRGKVVCRK